MGKAPHITLEQWRALIAVVDAGGYAQAAERLHKSQSTVTYAVQKLEAVLGVQAFELQGRKAVLTPTGQLLYRRAQSLLEDAGALEHMAGLLSSGWEPEISLAVEMLFPVRLVLDSLQQFGAESPNTRVELYESVMGGTTEALVNRQVDLAITGHVPPGFLGAQLLRQRALAVAHPAHPLQHMGRRLTLRDLREYRHLLIRETGSRRDMRPGMESRQRWIVSQSATMIRAVSAGYGFAWLAEELIRDELAAGLLKPLPLQEGGDRFVQLYLVLADRDNAGPGVLRMAQILRDVVSQACSQPDPAL